jgi:hypothetical protein
MFEIGIVSTLIASLCHSSQPLVGKYLNCVDTEIDFFINFIDVNDENLMW